MSKKHIYSTTPVDKVDVASLASAVGSACVVALDIAKEKMVASVWRGDAHGESVCLVQFRHPSETPKFLCVLESLQSAGVSVVAAMEPTGTYGDALRHQLGTRGIAVHSVSPKRVHDMAGAFDGVASLHDGKCATLIARLHAMGHSTPWPIGDEKQRTMRALLDLRRAYEISQHQQHGMMEAMLARHWPELEEWMSIRGQKSTLLLLSDLADPAQVASDPKGATTLLQKASHGALSPELVEGAVQSAVHTLGVPMVEMERELLRTLAKQLVESRSQIERIDALLRDELVEGSAGAHMAKLVGPYAAAIIVTLVDPLRSENARAFEKACGLNLREKSSGAHVGRLRITKRGPSLVRKALFLACLRLVHRNDHVRAWYKRRRAFTRDNRLAAIVAVMRKIARALFHIARGAVFDPAKLFDVRRLTLEPLPPEASLLPPKRTKVRSTVTTSHRRAHKERTGATA